MDVIVIQRNSLHCHDRGLDGRFRDGIMAAIISFIANHKPHFDFKLFEVVYSKVSNHTDSRNSGLLM